MEQLGELLRLRLTDRSLAAHNLRRYAAGTKHVQQVALAPAVLFHQAAQPAVGRRSFDGVVGILEASISTVRSSEYSRSSGVSSSWRLSNLLELGDEALILCFGTNDRRQLARQQTAVALWIYIEHGIRHRFFQSSLLDSSCVITWRM